MFLMLKLPRSGQNIYFLKQNEHDSSGYKNFLNGLPASSSCMCCNIESFKSKKASRASFNFNWSSQLKTGEIDLKNILLK